MVSHVRQVDRLSDCFSLTGVAVAWIRSYLSNSQQFTKIRDNSSGASLIESAIPQGSVLGPFLFFIVKSLFSTFIPNTVKFHQHADNMQLYRFISNSDFTSKIVRLQECIRDAYRLASDERYMLLNPRSTEGNCRHRRFVYRIVG